MTKISAVIIAKDEESRIGDCLDALSFCDEIIVVDGMSKDKTVEIAHKKGAKVFIHEFKDFSNARNFGLEKSAGEWILYVDADEIVTKELLSSIKQVLNQDKISAYKIKRKNYYLGNHEWPQVEKLERLFRKSKLKGWYGELHESPFVEGEIKEMDGFLIHYSHRNLTDMLIKTIQWSAIEANLRLKSKHPEMKWWRFPRVMITTFLNYYISQGGWKLGTAGLIESIYQSFSIFITYARLWELQQQDENINKKSL